MFGRYTDRCKRAIFFAQQTALRSGALAIDSNHLLLGLLIEHRSDGDIFRLRELLPEDAAGQDVIANQPAIKAGDIPLSDDAKRVVAYTAREANRLRDYWIDTEHLVLGILREENNAAASKLREVGLKLEACRQRVGDNKGSRPPRPNPVLWWVRQRPHGVILPVILPAVFVLGIIVALYLLGFGAR
jgi:ATP-dependent Clp protease ATP-binding subunit ClpC